MTLATTLLTLAIPLALGLISGPLRLFRNPEAAIQALNTYVLYLAFPVLIVVGMTDRAFTLPDLPGFYLVVPGVAVVLTGLLALLRRVPSVRDRVGGVALSALFANTAYIGLPVVEGVLGPDALGLGALAVAIHVTTAMLVGPTLLLTWSPGEAGGALARALAKVVRQPLAWAPVVGLILGRFDGVESLVGLFAPVGRTASPVGLFLIGLFLHTHGRQLRFDPGIGLHLVGKLLIVPAITFGLVSLAQALGQLDAQGAAVLVLLSVMPTAISAFSVSREFRVGTRDVTLAIIGSTLLAAALIPLVASQFA